MILAPGKRTNPTKSLFEVDLVFSLLLGANMLPFSFPKSTKIVSKPHLGMHRCFDRSWHRFFNELGSILEANLAPCWPLFPLWRDPLFFVGSMFFYNFLVILALSWRLLDSILEGRGSILKVFGSHFLHTFQVFRFHFFSSLSPMLKHFLH